MFLLLKQWMLAVFAHKWMALTVIFMGVGAPVVYLLSDFYHPPVRQFNPYNNEPVHRDAPRESNPVEPEAYLYTRGDQAGLHLAYSNDGMHWMDVNRRFITPVVGSRLFRDPHILRGPNGVFHMVWTTGWNDNGIGYAQSTDLINWYDQKFIPVMENTPGTKNCWAPETFYDDMRNEYIITWSSDVQGRFPATASPDRMNNRTYCVTTKDFRQFSPAQLFFEPGFDHIDATIFKDQGRYILAVKEGDMQNRGVWGPIHLAVASDPHGPYKFMKVPLISGQKVEGHTIARIGDEYVAYFHYYTGGRCGARKTRDFVYWSDASAEFRAVQGQSHGTVFAVPRSIVDRLIGM
ncbi:glycoside hydrolase family 43 protein [Candidatus Sumerlaeota bacterium]|nr:glycoside hydrolase family 43 protein [Candidatus Sumerlaeota bacterium]